MRRAPLLAATIAALALSACGEEPAPPPKKVVQAEKPRPPVATEKLDAAASPAVGDEGLPQGTPLAERVATLGLLNKRNNLTQDIALKPGQERRVGDVLIRLATCERRPPWDAEPEEGAFVQVFTTADPDEDTTPRWTRAFSGWLFRNSPSLNVVEHPIYDVWVKKCAMTFPGEEEAAPDADSKDAKPSGNAA